MWTSSSAIVGYFLVLNLLLGLSEGRYKNFEDDVTLTASQKKSLDQFKAKMVSIVPHEYMKKDMYLLRWLRSKEFDNIAARDALLQHLQWREENQIDTVLNEDWSEFEKEYPFYIEGKDKRGKPIIFYNIANQDMRKTIISGKANKLVRYVWSRLEMVTGYIRNLGEKYGNVTRGHLLVNMDGYNIIQQGCLRCIPLRLQLYTLVQKHYPGYVDQIILFNVPASVQPLLTAARPVMTKETQESLQIFGTNKNVWIKKLSDEFDFNELPPVLGGTKIYKGMDDDY